MNDVKRLSDSDSSSCDSLAGLDLPTIFPTARNGEQKAGSRDNAARDECSVRSENGGDPQ